MEGIPQPPTHSPEDNMCNCIFNHPQTDEQRAELMLQLWEFIVNNDSQGAKVAYLRLFTPCPNTTNTNNNS